MVRRDSSLRSDATRRSISQLLVSVVVLGAVYIVMTPWGQQRSSLLSWPTHPAPGSHLHHWRTFSADRDRQFKEVRKQDNGELDIDVSDDPMEEQVSNMDVSVEVKRPMSKRHRAMAAGLTGHHETVNGVSAAWARKPRTTALAQEAPRPAKTQELSSDYLEDQGINTGEEYNHILDNPVEMGNKNPSVFFAAGREVPDLQPNPPATASPRPPLNKLSHMGVYTGTEKQQWDDNMIESQGMEEPYNFGASPTRELNSPSRAAGSWGVFKPKDDGYAMLAQDAESDMAQVLAEKHALEDKADVKVDSIKDVDNTVPEHMQVHVDPRKAWDKVPPSNGRLNEQGVNTGDDHQDLGDVRVAFGEVSPVHLSNHKKLESAGVNTGDMPLIHAEKGPQVYVPNVVPTAAPRKTKQHKLDKLGVNTGDEHTQWGDSMVSHEGLEPSYNIGPSPNREYTTAMPFPGTVNWPASSKKDSIFGAINNMRIGATGETGALEQQLRARQKQELRGLAEEAALPYEIEADAAQARAAEAEAQLASDMARARREEQAAALARSKAGAVGKAASVLAEASAEFTDAQKDFALELARARSNTPRGGAEERREVAGVGSDDLGAAKASASTVSASADEAGRRARPVGVGAGAESSKSAVQDVHDVQGSKARKPRLGTRQMAASGERVGQGQTQMQTQRKVHSTNPFDLAAANLDAEAKKDRAENRELASPDDLDSMMATLNSDTRGDRTNRYAEPNRPVVEPVEAGPMAATEKKDPFTLQADKLAGIKSTAQIKSAAHTSLLHSASRAPHGGKQSDAQPLPTHTAATRSRRNSISAAQRRLHAHGRQHAGAGIAMSKKELCNVSVWGVHPLCALTSSLRNEVSSAKVE